MTLADSLRHLSRSAPDQRSDGDLVAEFVRTQDEPAFAELLRRHGPTVYGVCRRVLGNGPDADDAFQGVFLVLARKARAICPPGMVGNWLYGVAVRTANKAHAMNARRAKREQGAPRDPRAEYRRSDPDTLAVIDAELAALPAVYRAVFVACDMNDRSRSEAAKALGWPEGTVAARLAKARELLAARLRKRGVTLGAATFATALVPPAVAAETLAAVRELLAVGTATAATPTAQQLSDEVVKTMGTFKLKLVAVGLLVLGLAAGTAVLVAAPGAKPGPRAEREPVANAPVPREAAMEWKETKPITFDAGRVTGVAYSPSGKTLAVARDNGRIDFYDPATRKFITTMDVTEGTKAGTVTVVAFAPKPHPKNGDIFAATHKHGVKFGTVGLGIFTDDAARVDGIPANIVAKDFDPHQVTCLGDDRFVASNGEELVWRVPLDKQDMRLKLFGGKRGQPGVLAALPGHSGFFLENGHTEKEVTDVYMAAEPPASSPQIRLSGHKSRPVAAAVSKDGKRIVSADAGGMLIVWEPKETKLDFTERSRLALGEGVAQLALAPDGKTVAVVRAFTDTRLLGFSGRVLTNLELFVFDVSDPPVKPKPLWSARNVLGDRQAGGPFSIAFGPDGKTLLAAFADPYITDKDAKSIGVRVWELVPKK